MSNAQPKLNRHKKRSLAKELKKPSNQESPKKALQERVAQLEVRLEAYGKAFDQNTQVFSDSLKMAESMQMVFQRVMNDYVQHGSFTFEKYGLPDWHEYMRYYWLCELVADFARWLAGLNPQPVQAEESKLVRPGDEQIETTIFGG